MRVAAAVHVILAPLDVGVRAAPQRHHDAAVILENSGLCGLSRILRGIRSLLALCSGSIAASRAAKGRQRQPRSSTGNHNTNDKRGYAGNGDNDSTAHGTGALLLAVTLGVRTGLLGPGGRLRAIPVPGAQHAHVTCRLATMLPALLHAPLDVARGTGAGDLLDRILWHVARNANVVTLDAAPVVVLPVCHEPSPIRLRPPNTAFSTLKDSKARSLQLKPARPPRGAHHATVSSRGAPCPR